MFLDAHAWDEVAIAITDRTNVAIIAHADATYGAAIVDVKVLGINHSICFYIFLGGNFII